MTETVSNEQVEEAREYVDLLREQIQEEKGKSAQIAAENTNVVRKAALDAEAERLEAELAALREANSPSTVQAQAQAQADALAAANQPQVVDTTPPPPPLPNDDGPADDEN